MPVVMELLSAAARLAYPYVRSMVEEGLSANSIQSTLQSMGMGFRRQELLSLVRGIKDISITRNYFDSLREDYFPSLARLAKPVTRTLRDQSYNVRVTGTLLETGDQVERYVTISTNQRLTKRQIMDAALEMVSDPSLGTPSGQLAELVSWHAARILSGTWVGNL